MRVDFPLLHRGKIRELYRIDNDRILIVTTDKISAFNFTLPNIVPGKGEILNQLSSFWFERTKHIVPNHMITTDLQFLHDNVDDSTFQYLKGRSMVVRSAKRIDLECVVRRFLCGSAWREYEKNQSVNGIELKPGLKERDRLSELLFTPALKRDTGHDENISVQEAKKIVGVKIFHKIREYSLKLFHFGENFLFPRGIVLADAKFEFGIIDDEVILIDEIFTPDCSRLWLQRHSQSRFESQPLDKELLREYLRQINWNPKSPPPTIPHNVLNDLMYFYRQYYKIVLEP